MIKKNKKGFTLVEIIVAVTIIMLITVVSVVSYTSTNRKSRDGRRMADLEKIRIALELYRQGVGVSYPSAASLTTSLVPTYIQQLPTDPKTGTSYTYSSTNSGYGYTLATTVEDAGSSNFSGYQYRVYNP